MPTTASRPGPARRPAQPVTTARPSQEDDRRHRMRGYLIAMSIRTLSFPVAVWAFLNDHLVVGWVFVVLAVVIPSFAVMLANAVDRRGRSGPAPQSPVPGLGPAGPPMGPSPNPATEGPPLSGTLGDVVPGTVLARREPDEIPEPRPQR